MDILLARESAAIEVDHLGGDEACCGQKGYHFRDDACQLVLRVGADHVIFCSEG